MSELDLLLSVPTLLELVEQFPSFTDPLPFTRLFSMGESQDLDGDLVIYEKIQNDRRLAAVRGHSAEPFAASEPDSILVKQGTIQSAEKETITAERLFLRGGGGVLLKSNADQVVVRAVRRIISRLLRTREYVAATLLQSAAGVALTSANTAFVANAITVTNTVNIQGGLQTVAAPTTWDIATTKMLSAAGQLLTFKRTMENNGFRPARFIMNQRTEAAIVGNLEAQTWLTANGASTMTIINRALETGPRIQGNASSANRDDAFEANAFSGLGGVRNWHTWDHHYTNGAAAVTRYLADGIGIMLPEELDEVLGFAEGIVFIPSDEPVIGDAEQAAELFSARNGINVYAYRPEGTTSVVIVGVDSFLPYVKNELGVLNITGLTT